MQTEAWETYSLGDVLTPTKRAVTIEDAVAYEQVTVRIRGNGLTSRGVLHGHEIGTKKQFKVSPGDLLVSKIDARNGGLGFVPAELDGAVVTGDFPAYSVNEAICDREYLALYVGRQLFWDECLLVSEGSTNRVRLVPEQFLELELSLPPLTVQERSVQTVKTVDVALTAARRVAAGAEHAFRAAALDLFDGFDAGWERLGDVTTLASGGTPSRKDAGNFGGTIPWVKTGEVRFNRLTDTQEKITEQGLRTSSAKLLPAGTVLLAMYGQGATRGRCALLEREMTTNQACAAILPSPRLVPEFVFFFLWSRYEAIRAESEGSAQDNLNQGQVADIEIPVPDVDEQREVSQVLAALRRVADAKGRETRALEAFRSALVEDLVTDVRQPPQMK